MKLKKGLHFNTEAGEGGGEQSSLQKFAAAAVAEGENGSSAGGGENKEGAEGENKGAGEEENKGGAEGENKGAEGENKGAEGENKGAEGENKAGQNGGEDTEDVLNPVEVPENLEDFDWPDVAKDIGFEIKPEEGYAGVVTGVKKMITEAETRGRESAEEVNFEKYSPDQRIALKAFGGGLKLPDLINPVRNFDNLLSLPNEEIVRQEKIFSLGLTKKFDKDGNLSEADQKMLDDEMGVIKDQGSLDREAQKIRTALEGKRDQVFKETVSKYEKAWDDEQKKLAASIKDKNEKIRSEITSRKEFLGGKLTEQHQSSLMKKVESGHYDTLLKDPKEIAEFIFWKEFGKSRIEKIKTAAKTEAQVDQFKKNSNVPPGNNGGGASHKQSGEKGQKSGLAAFAEQAQQEGISGITRG